MAQKALLSSPLGSSAVVRRNHAKVLQRASSVRSARRVIRIAAKAHEDDSQRREASAAFMVALGSFLAASPALAEGAATAKAVQAPATTSTPVPPEAVDSAVSQIIDAVKATGGAVKSGIGVASQGAGYVRDAADAASPYLKKGIDVATPYVKATANLAGEVAKPVLKAAVPVVQYGVEEVEQFLTKQGLNAQSFLEGTRGVTSKAGEALSLATPTVKSTAGSITSSSPQVLAEYALGLVALYYLGPPALKGIFGSLRGYAGQVSPAAALDAAANDNNAVIVDIRSASEKEYAGIPDIPNGNRLVELEYAVVNDRKIRNLLRNVGTIEKQMTVLQVAALKKVKKSSRILLLDKNGGVAKDIARSLTSKGFKRVYVISGGFSGWTSSKLQTRGSSSVSSVEILSPVFGTRSSTTRSDRPVKAQRYLPSGR